MTAEIRTLAVETDTELFPIESEIFMLEYGIRKARKSMSATGYRRPTPLMIESYEEQILKAQVKIEELTPLAAPLQAIYAANLWTRFILVPAGHLHRGTGCSTLRWNTERYALPEYSGADETEIVGLAGERACTVCFPSAPVDRPSMLPVDVAAREAGEEINTDPEEGDLTPVTTRTYTFDKNGNRTKLATSVNGTQTATRSWAYDAADRVGVSAGYTYDGLGRQTKIPAADAPRINTTAAAKGDITIGYYADDAARSITRNGITTIIERDPAGRRLNLTATGTGNTGKETKHYADDSDNPAWSTRTIGSTTTTTRYESTIGGDLALTITNNQVELAVNNPHGDTVTTIPLTGTGAGQGINGWAQFDEYGNQLSDTVNTGATTYGWHGADQRALDASGLILMGARLYNSVTGLFTSRDPVEGGNTTTYTYPQDPVGKNDISGEAWWKSKKFWDTTDSVMGIVAFAGPWGAGASAVYSVGRGIYKLRSKKNRDTSGGIADLAGALTFGVGKGLIKGGQIWKKSKMKKLPKGGPSKQARANKTKRIKTARKYRKYNNRVVKRYHRLDRSYGIYSAATSGWGTYREHYRR